MGCWDRWWRGTAEKGEMKESWRLQLQLQNFSYNWRPHISPHNQCSKHCSSWKVCLERQKLCPERRLSPHYRDSVLPGQRHSRRISPSWCPFYTSLFCCPVCQWSTLSFLPFNLGFNCTMSLATVGLIQWEKVWLFFNFYLFADSFLSVALGRNTRKLLMFFSLENQGWITTRHTLCSLIGIWLCSMKPALNILNWLP